ncbi:MAG TPA: hypothetical protein VKS22_03450 [Candidatus Binataceae bacterium]|nr:hypothetical protein [Candidatus Binataceae bacterium]
MLSRKQILSAMAGVAMMAMPVTALAKHRGDNYNPRPYAYHDRGFHNGWAQHRLATAEPSFNPHRYYAEPRVAPNWYGRNDNQGARRYWAEPRPIGWNNNQEPRRYWAQPQPTGWNNGYPPSWNRNYQCDDDGDGDSCRWTNNYGSQYWQNNGGYNYGAPYSWYQAQPPANLGIAQQRAWLINRRQRAMGIIARMRARGDNRGANRMLGVVRGLDQRIASLNRRIGYNGNPGYAPAAYGPSAFAPNAAYGQGVNYPASSPLSALLTGAAPYYGNSNYGNASQYYGNTAYGSPTTNALVAALPLLLGAH